LGMDYDNIVNKRIRRIDRDHACSVAEVNALEHHLIELDRDTFLNRTLAIDLVELDELQRSLPREGTRGSRHLGRCGS
jgi:hypothetical protein